MRSLLSASACARLALGFLIAAFSASSVALAQKNAPPLLEVQLSDGAQAGLPIHWDDQFALLLQPSGSMLDLEMNLVRGHRLLDQPFVPQSLTAARSALQAEMGASFDTTTVGPYVICAPRGHADRWRERFRVVLAGYHRYFETRGWRLRTPDFPLCVTVLASKAEFDRYCQQQIGQVKPNLMGCYFPKSNRCVLFEVGASGPAGGSPATDWSETERTIVHEAVHQLAYNTGVHERLASTPQWVVEGLATMFEEPAVFDPRASSRSIEARLNAQQLYHLRPLLADPARFEAGLSDLIESNTLFNTDGKTAYALSWALTFYLAERMSNQYGSFTQSMARLPKLQPYGAAERGRDFQRAFESDVSLLALQMQKFYSSFK